MHIAVAGASGLVGRSLVEAGRRAGHQIRELSRSAGVDLTRDTPDLDGVEVIIDVTNSPDQDQVEAIRFFTVVADHLARAASRAGVSRTVLLSIIGVDRTPDDGYFQAKLAHEQATRDHAPGVRILRSAQFHDFPGQMLSWTRQGDHATIPDQPVQPVDLDEVVRTLLELAAVDHADVITEIAGPRPERLPELVARLDPTVTVTPGPVSAAVRDHALLPGPDARLVGGDFAHWLARRGIS